MKAKTIIPLLLIFLIILIVLLTFNNNEQAEIKETTYTAEEIIEPTESIPEESKESPTVEESQKEIQVLNKVEIEIRDWSFYPNEITISPGTTVVWINKDKLAHKIIAYDRVFYSPRLEPNEKYAFTFVNEGTHNFFDGVFPKTGRGKIIVKSEPLPITGGVIGVDLSREESNAKFALLVLSFPAMIIALSYYMHKNYKI